MTAFDALLIGDSARFREVIHSAQVVAATDVNVLLLGETGTGKERMARAIHEESPRGDARFIAVNCASLPEGLAESLLFGHRKGAFTSAVQDHKGYLPAADGGTLFLDEVGELPLAVQAKMLRFLESGECLPVGHTQALPVNVRIVAATNRDLSEMVKAGRFRADLFRLHLARDGGHGDGQQRDQDPHRFPPSSWASRTSSASTTLSPPAATVTSPEREPSRVDAVSR